MKLAPFGADEKIGKRLSANLKKTNGYETLHVEVSEEERARLKKEFRVETVDADKALEGADIVILAVQVTLIGKIAYQIIDQVKAGAMLVCLAGASPFAGRLPKRADVSNFMSHPCHPPIWNDETEMDAKRDYFGGIAAKQGIANLLIQGSESNYEVWNRVGRAIYVPMVRSHRVTLQQFAFLESGLSETVNGSLVVELRQAIDEVIRKGVS